MRTISFALLALLGTGAPYLSLLESLPDQELNALAVGGCRDWGRAGLGAAAPSGLGTALTAHDAGALCAAIATTRSAVLGRDERPARQCAGSDSAAIPGSTDLRISSMIQADLEACAASGNTADCAALDRLVAIADPKEPIRVRVSATGAGPTAILMRLPDGGSAEHRATAAAIGEALLAGGGIALVPSADAGWPLVTMTLHYERSPSTLPPGARPTWRAPVAGVGLRTAVDALAGEPDGSTWIELPPAALAPGASIALPDSTLLRISR